MNSDEHVVPFPLQMMSPSFQDMLIAAHYPRASWSFASTAAHVCLTVSKGVQLFHKRHDRVISWICLLLGIIFRVWNLVYRQMIKRAQGRNRLGRKNFKKRYFCLTNQYLSYAKAKGWKHKWYFSPSNSLFSADFLFRETTSGANFFNLIMRARDVLEYIDYKGCFTMMHADDNKQILLIGPKD